MSNSIKPRVVRCVLIGCLVSVCVSGCLSKGLPPVADRSPVANPRSAAYLVRAGDTLYSIAWRHDRDFRQLARLNGIAPPFQIVPGQRLQLVGEAPAAVSKAPAAASKKPAAASKAPAATYKKPAATYKKPATKPTAPKQKIAKQSTPPAAVAAKPAGPLSWRWPVQTSAVKAFGSAGNKGIDFALAGATNIKVAARGEVVYAGAGLGGFRYLVIVKHSERYLSAYGFDATLQVLEGQRVDAGATLANVPAIEQEASQSLHFELRRDGVPVNPTAVIDG